MSNKADATGASPPKQKKSLSEGAWEFLWGLPILFPLGATVLFIARRNEQLSWNLYLLAWAALMVMSMVGLLLRKKPHMPSLKVGLLLLVVQGAFNLLEHHESFPYLGVLQKSVAGAFLLYERGVEG
ncbi:hypothetical protein ABZ070_34285 [Streptomyces sp. NPDC006283]|uniref:hypothetical protein n=1 Tax=Streptomyces sp. NPDC006283 TaxID=3156741 RepID=UPI0033A43226